MRRARIHRCIVAPVVALVLFVSGLRSAYATYRCAGDDVVRSSCCCPRDKTAKDQDQTENRERAINAGCCCEIEVAEAVASMDVRVGSEGASTYASPALSSQLWHGGLSGATVRASQTPSARPDVQPRSGPPLRFAKQSFLI